jgi:hypothetical protein
MDKKVIASFVILLFAVSLVSAVWWNPFSWGKDNVQLSPGVVSGVGYWQERGDSELVHLILGGEFYYRSGSDGDWNLLSSTSNQGGLNVLPKLGGKFTIPNFGFYDKISEQTVLIYGNGDVYTRSLNGNFVRNTTYTLGISNFVPKTGYWHPFGGGRINLWRGDGKLYIYNPTQKVWLDRTGTQTQIGLPSNIRPSLSYWYGLGSEGGRIDLWDVNNKVYTYNPETNRWTESTNSQYFSNLPTGLPIVGFYDESLRKVVLIYADGKVYTRSSLNSNFILDNNYFDYFDEEVECNNYYWFDNTHQTCGYKEFCGVYQYSGLRIFGNLQQCLSALGGSQDAGDDLPPPTITISCRDTDATSSNNGINYLSRGNTILNSYSSGNLNVIDHKQDGCLPNGNLTEYYCSGTGDRILEREYDCKDYDARAICVNGACINVSSDSLPQGAIIKNTALTFTIRNDYNESQLAEILAGTRSPVEIKSYNLNVDQSGKYLFWIYTRADATNKDSIFINVSNVISRDNWREWHFGSINPNARWYMYKKWFGDYEPITLNLVEGDNLIQFGQRERVESIDRIAISYVGPLDSSVSARIPPPLPSFDPLLEWETFYQCKYSTKWDSKVDSNIPSGMEGYLKALNNFITNDILCEDPYNYAPKRTTIKLLKNPVQGQTSPIYRFYSQNNADHLFKKDNNPVTGYSIENNGEPIGYIFNSQRQGTVELFWCETPAEDGLYADNRLSINKEDCIGDGYEVKSESLGYVQIGEVERTEINEGDIITLKANSGDFIDRDSYIYFMSINDDGNRVNYGFNANRLNVGESEDAWEKFEITDYSFTPGVPVKELINLTSKRTGEALKFYDPWCLVFIYRFCNGPANNILPEQLSPELINVIENPQLFTTALSPSIEEDFKIGVEPGQRNPALDDSMCGGYMMSLCSHQNPDAVAQAVMIYGLIYDAAEILNAYFARQPIARGITWIHANPETGDRDYLINEIQIGQHLPQYPYNSNYKSRYGDVVSFMADGQQLDVATYTRLNHHPAYRTAQGLKNNYFLICNEYGHCFED